jgi:FtsH-binding integral membrane protein
MDATRGDAMSDVRKEQIKLRAAYYNGVAIAIVAIGGLGVALATLRERSDLWTFGAAVFGLVGAAVLSIALREIAISSLAALDEE